jgi:hypothetical protein
MMTSPEYADLMMLDPDAAKAAKARWDGMSNKRKEEYFTDFGNAANLAQAGDIDGAMQLLSSRYMSIVEEGGDPVDTVRAIRFLGTDPKGFVENVNNMSQARYQQDALPGQKPSSEFAPSVSPVQVDQETGQQYVVYSDRNAGTSTRVDIVNGKALTEDDKIQKDIRKTMITDAIERGNQAFDRIEGIESNIQTLEKAVSTIDAGARAGAIDNLMPTLDKATIELRQLSRQLGLDVIANTTFGALSEGELRLAMDTAVPPLDEPDLKKWFQERIDARKKLKRELVKMARELGSGKMTIPEYIEKNTVKPEEDEFSGFEVLPNG